MVDFKVDKFNGPLDLLLELIKKEKLDITKISLVKITDQFLERLEEMKERAVDEMADFLLVAAKLILMKSKALLPKVDEEEEDEGDLINQLKLYKEYLEASKKIDKIIGREKFLFSRNFIIRSEVVFSPPSLLSKELLAETYELFLNDLKKFVVETEKERIVRKVSLRERIMEIYEMLETEDRFTLNSFFNESTKKEEKVVSFLAILELVKQNDVYVLQDSAFDDIVIEKVKK